MPQVATNFAKLLMLDAECVHPYDSLMHNLEVPGIHQLLGF